MVMDNKKQYLIEEDTLKKLLVVNHLYALSQTNTGDWLEYVEERTHYLIEAIKNLPWNTGKSYPELANYVYKTGYDINCLVEDTIEAFWEEYKEPITAHWTGMDGDQCSHCDRSLRNLMDADSYYSSEFEDAGFDQLKACPFCGARIVKDA